MESTITEAKELAGTRGPVGDIEIGRRIRELREAIGLSGPALAKALGLSYSAIKELEGGRATKQYMQLREIARVLGTTPNHILGFEKVATPDEQTELLATTMEAVKGLLTELGYESQAADALASIALESGRERQIHNVDRRLAARTAAVLRLRQAAIALPKPESGSFPNEAKGKPESDPDRG